MIARLRRYGDQLARATERRKAMEVAKHLKTVLRGASLSVEESLIVISGRGLSKRWLGDPRLRFLGGHLK